MSAKFTPGPWDTEYHGEEGWSVSKVGGLCIAGLYAAEVRPLSGIRDKRQEKANARLIAAAPDMYEALKAIDGLAVSHVKGAMPKAQKIARAALAKADGK